ncbi:MAG TPA: ABC transporter permease [Candidatus Limnocylindria bacterium]|nr:ABC transporter permease [Candidatus Limnocylindria bacterium]
MSSQTVVAELNVAAGAPRRAAGFWSDAIWRLRQDRTTMVALGFVGLMVAAALGADLLAEHVFRISFAKQDLLRTFERPSLANEPAFWLGADNIGRSEIVRLLYGARVSLAVGFFAALCQFTIGLALGVSAGYFKGWWDDVVVWMISTLNGIPTLYLLIIVGLLFRLDPVSLALFIGLLGWTGEANLARGQTFAWRERDFVVAARTIGATPGRIMLRHIVPNILPIMVVTATITIAGVILAESAISFLGFGIQPPVPSWGNMLTGATGYYYKGPHLILVPGVAISVTVLCLYLIGDGLRDALDPRLRGTTGVRRKR